MTLDDLIEVGLRMFRRNAFLRVPTSRVSDGAMRAEMDNRLSIGNPTHIVYCAHYQHYHPIHWTSNNELVAAVANFKAKHPNHLCGLSSVPIWAREGWIPNSDFKEAMQTEQSLTVTNLHSLASSATAGWGSAAIDNSTNLYPDSQVMLHFAAVNTAPASDKAIYTSAYGSTDGAIWTSSGTSGGTIGTEGAVTWPSISTLPNLFKSLGYTAYPVQNKALDDGPYSVARCFGGILPISWGVSILNFSGMTLAAAANTVKYRGLYNTII